jgi:polyisoprenoid-binding protein YceI
VRTPLVYAALVAALFSSGLQAQPETYAISPLQSELLVFVHKDGIAARLAHNHIIYADKFEGKMTFDPENHRKNRIRVVVDAKSLVPDSPVLIKKYGVDNDASLSDRTEIEKTMKGPLQLDVKKFPRIVFDGGLSKPIVNGQTEISGRLTLHGVTRKIRVPATIDDAPHFVRGTARIPLKLTDFGITPYSAFLGAIKIKNEVELMVDVFANKAPMAGTQKGSLKGKKIQVKVPVHKAPPPQPKRPGPGPDPLPPMKKKNPTGR